MAQRKKKQSSHQQQKIAKAKHKNEFLSKLKYLTNSVCKEDIYSLIPKEMLEEVYSCRYHTVRIELAEGCNVSSHIHNLLKRTVSAWLKSEKISLAKGVEISFDDYYTIALSSRYIKTIKFINLPDIGNLKKGIETLYDMVGGALEEAQSATVLALFAFCLGFSCMEKSLYWFKLDLSASEDYGEGLHHLAFLHSVEVESINIVVDGTSRPAKRVGWAFTGSGLLWATLKPSILNVKGPFADIPVDVYIQSHALQRLNERLDCFEVGTIQMSLYESLRDAKVVFENCDQPLIEYKFFGTKVGYLRADYVDGVILIRTFLFITNNGTPEGKKLEKVTGLQKLDKKYLAIDRMSAFNSSDMSSNPEVREIFESAGCGNLISLYKEIALFSNKQSNQNISKLLLDYLKKAEVFLQGDVVPEHAEAE
ncbi:MAG: hypothetical protein HXX16_11395 [Bacteroidales bacterium]|nr:hypothetical protein [Bacteroidales bacterium]